MSFTVVLRALTFPSSRRAIKKKTAAMRNAGCLIPFLHVQELTGVINEGIKNTGLEDN